MENSQWTFGPSPQSIPVNVAQKAASRVPPLKKPRPLACWPQIVEIKIRGVHPLPPLAFAVAHPAPL
jgi:hypothetical protein